jgi:hypothetical protein
MGHASAASVAAPLRKRGVALWMSVPVMLAWRGRILTWPEWLLFTALPLALGGVLLAS